jgi:hypothetical protein
VLLSNIFCKSLFSGNEVDRYKLKKINGKKRVFVEDSELTPLLTAELKRLKIANNLIRRAPSPLIQSHIIQSSKSHHIIHILSLSNDA